MNTRGVNALAGVIQAAMQTRQTAAGIAMAVEAAGMLQSPETAAEMVELRKRVAEIDARRLGDLSSLMSIRCGKPTHPVWLTARTDRRGCPWCRLAELERLQQPVGRTVYLADYDGAEDGPKIFASLDAAKAWVEEWSTGDTWDWFDLDGVHEQWTCDADSDRPTNRGNGTVTPLVMPAGLETASAEGGDR